MGLRFMTLAAAIGLSGVVIPALAQDSLSDRLDRLERDLTTLQSQVYKGRATAGPPAVAGAAAPSIAATYSVLDDRISAIENALPGLTDQIERANFAITQLQAKLDRAQADNEFRFKDLETRTAGLVPPSPPPSQPTSPLPLGSAPAPSAAPGGDSTGTSSGFLQHRGAANDAAPAPAARALPPNQTPQELYQSAWGLLRNNDYDGAKPAFEAFLAQYPKDPLAGNAAFWLGRIYFIEEKYDKAALIFFDAYSKYPKSAKAGESLLHVGLSMGNLGKKKEACAALHQFGVEFRDASEDLRRQANAEKRKQGC